MSGNAFQEILSPLMRAAVVQLGLDPDLHNVTLQPHQLLVYGSWKEKSSTYKFDNQPAGIFYIFLFLKTI